MPIKLTPAEMAFVERVRAYCAEGLTQSEMAEREDISLGAFRDRLKRYSLIIESQVRRRIVRLKTGEPLEDLLESGELIVAASAA